MFQALTHPFMSADLSKLNLFRSDGVEFIPIELVKQSRLGKPIQNLFFPSCPDMLELCPVQALRAYKKRTESLREEESRLLVKIIKPHKAVTFSTIARWLKTILGAASMNLQFH